MTAFNLVYPRWRGLAGLVVVVMSASLVGVNYHFVSDVIAGALLGYIVTTTTYHFTTVFTPFEKGGRKP